MTKLTISIGVALLASLTTAHADMYLYSCKVEKKNLPLVVDDEANTLSWNKVEYKGITNANEEEVACARSGWHVADGEASFDFCTATQGGGYIQQLGKMQSVCQLQTTFAAQNTFSTPVEKPVPEATVQPSNPPPPVNSTSDPVANWLDKWSAQQKKIADTNRSPPPQSEPSPPVEELSCNSDTVKRILVNGTVNKTASESAKLAQLFKNNAQLYADLVQVSRWSGTVVNVRETNRAPGKVSCAAEFEWQNMPSKQAMANVGVILLAQGIEDKSCIKINYHVQPLLDKPGQINVSWRCNDG